MDSRASKHAVQHATLILRSLLAATDQFCTLIGQKMQLTGWDNGHDNMHDATWLQTRKLHLSSSTAPSLYCENSFQFNLVYLK